MELALGIILMIAAGILIVTVLLQDNKESKLSGAIAGGADTFLGKSKTANKNKKLSIATTIVSIVFVVLVLVSYLMQ